VNKDKAKKGGKIRNDSSVVNCKNITSVIVKELAIDIRKENT